jgi:hypothetical protein
VFKAFAGIIVLLLSMGFASAVFMVTTVRSEVAQAKSDLRAEIKTARDQDMGYLRSEISGMKETQNKMLEILLQRKTKP